MFIYKNETVLEDLGNGVNRRILAHGGTMMAVEVNFTKGAVGPMHSHPHEQLTYVLSGRFNFTIDGVTKEVSAGDTLYKSPMLSTVVFVWKRERCWIPSRRNVKTFCPKRCRA